MNANRGALTLAVIALLVLIAARPAQAQTETVLYSFAGGPDGAAPDCRLTSDGAGNFYGTTHDGGVGYGDGNLGYGTVFELSPNGKGGWNEKLLYSFTGGADGANPSSSYVVFDGTGNLYGTTYGGGANGFGVVFELSPQGANWKEAVLHTFSGPDGAGPVNGLIFDSESNLYGTTLTGGDSGFGTVFELSPIGGEWTEEVLYSISGSSRGISYAGVTMDAAGNIFGTTESTVFELSPNGSGGWNPTVIHTFTGPTKDGSFPQGTLVFDKAGNLYGTTENGGAFGEQFGGYGTVYKLSPEKKGSKVKILHSFKGDPKDGVAPVAGIVFDASGNLYGTTYEGGKSGLGTVFELVAPVGKGSYQEKVLWSFNGPDGSEPFTSVVLDSEGSLYGTTLVGGSTDQGGIERKRCCLRSDSVGHSSTCFQPLPRLVLGGVSFCPLQLNAWAEERDHLPQC